MRRRRVLFGISAVVAGFAGCLVPNIREMSMEASENSPMPGVEWRVIIEAENISGMHLSSVPRNEGGEPGPIEFITFGAQSESSGVQVSPIPDRETDSSPPYWFWNSRVSVEAMVPYTVSDDAEPGEYEYEVTVFADDNPDSKSKTEAFTITIQDS